MKNFFKFILLTLIILLQNFNIEAKTGNWGLSFPKPGESPIGNESCDYLKNYNAYFIGKNSEKVIYLTFDAGYENGYTDKILDTLKKNQVPATFFLCGNYFKENPDMVKKIVAEGHIIGNHTMSHPDMSKITDKKTFERELSQIEELYKSITGNEIKKFYRPPMGKYNAESLQMAKDLGYSTIFWSLAYMDFDDKNQPTKEVAFSKLIPRIHPGAILLLHNTSKSNSLILDELIQKYHEMGYEFKSLEHLISECQ